MSITCSPSHSDISEPDQDDRTPARPLRAVMDLVRFGLVAILLVGIVALGVFVLESRSAARLDAVMTARAGALLPGSRIEMVEIADAPALLAEHQPTIQRTTALGHTPDGHPVNLVVLDYDRATSMARSVSWQIVGFPLPAGWRPVSTANPYLSQAEREIDGHQVQVTATASLRGNEVLVAPAGLTVDGAATNLSEAPATIRAAVEPMLALQRMTVPLGDVDATVRYVWFEEGGMGVELRATQVPVGGTAT